MTTSTKSEDVEALAERLYRSSCPECRGTGQRDTGGIYPWGEGIFMECDCHDAMEEMCNRK